ncbi:MAG: aminotransferase class IV [Balneolaceae bacterium]
MVSWNGRLVTQAEAAISAGSEAVRYGMGCFETFRAEQGRVLLFEDHWQRLMDGARWLGADSEILPDGALVRQELNALLEASGLSDAVSRVRVQLTLRSEGGYGADVSGIDRLITAVPLNEIQQDLRLIPVSVTTIPGTARPASLKLCNMLHYRAAKREALAAGFEDGILCTPDGYVAEVSIGNLFWRKGKDIFTSNDSCHILPGIMRRIVMGLIDEMEGVELHTGRYLPGDLESADQAWVTNSVREIQWVSQIGENLPEPDHDFRERLVGRLRAYKDIHME